MSKKDTRIHIHVWKLIKINNITSTATVHSITWWWFSSVCVWFVFIFSGDIRVPCVSVMRTIKCIQNKRSNSGGYGNNKCNNKINSIVFFIYSLSFCTHPFLILSTSYTECCWFLFITWSDPCFFHIYLLYVFIHVVSFFALLCSTWIYSRLYFFPTYLWQPQQM